MLTKICVLCVPVFYSLPLIFTLVAASISHFYNGNFHVFIPTTFVFFVFLSNTLALSLLSTSVKTLKVNQT